MAQLPKPTKDVATRILSEVGFDNRLVGFDMKPRAGNTPMSLYSFAEATNFLHVDSLDDLLIPGGRGSVGYIELAALQKWVDQVMGDKDLASAIGEAVKQNDCYHDQAIAVKELMAERLSQCKETMKA